MKRLVPQSIPCWLVKDASLKEVPIDADAVIINFDGNADAVRKAATKAIELIEAHQLQAARQILDHLASEIRICQSPSKSFHLSTSNFFQLRGLIRGSDQPFCAA